MAHVVRIRNVWHKGWVERRRCGQQGRDRAVPNNESDESTYYVGLPCHGPRVLVVLRGDILIVSHDTMKFI